MKLRQGFTLVELMIVVAIIGILMAAMAPKIAGVFGNTNDAVRSKTAEDFKNVMTEFYGRYSTYPNSPFCLEGNSTDEDVIIGNDRRSGNDLTVANLKDLFTDSNYPEDPSPNVYSEAACNGYYYLPVRKTPTSRAASSYILFAGAEGNGKVSVSCEEIGGAIVDDGTFYVGDLDDYKVGSDTYPTAEDITPEFRCMYTTGG